MDEIKQLLRSIQWILLLLAFQGLVSLFTLGMIAGKP